MNIIVCIKPSSDSAERTNGSAYTLSTYDASALEMALSLKDVIENGRVTVLSMYPSTPKIKTVLKNTFKVGVDEVIHLSGILFKGADTLATSYALAMAINKIDKCNSINLILCGKQSSDSNTSQVGGSIAEWLNIPHATCISEVKIADAHIECKRLLEDGFDNLRIELPALLTIEKGKPLRPRTGDLIEAARDRTIIEWGLDDINAEKAFCGKAGSPTKVDGSLIEDNLHGEGEVLSAEDLVERIRLLSVV